MKNSGNTHQGLTEAQLAEKRAEAYRLRLRGMPLRDVGRALGVSHETVRQWTQVEADSLVLPLADEFRKQQLDRLDIALAKAMAVLDGTHLTVSHGRVVMLEDAETGARTPIVDQGPVLAAIDRIVRLEERRSKLMGLDAPARTEIEARVDDLRPEVLNLIEAAEAQAAADVERLGDGDDDGEI